MKQKRRKGMRILERFIGNLVIVETSLEPVAGVLVDFEHSQHGGLVTFCFLRGEENGFWLKRGSRLKGVER